MFEPNSTINHSPSSPPHLQTQQTQVVMEQFTRQIKLLQSRLAFELHFNTFLVEKANLLPPTENQNHYPLPQFDFCYQEGIKREIIVKKQLGQPLSEKVNNFVQEKSMKSQVKLQQDQKESEQRNEIVKIQSHSFIKIQDESLSSEQPFNDKNQTKNIPKNYGKAILSFIQKNIEKYSSFVRPILLKHKLRVSDLLNHIKKLKREVNSILCLKLMWGYENTSDPIFKCIRVLSHIFMRKYCLPYIFNSRVKNYNTHIKYRRRILQGIENPAEFTYIKQF